MKKNLITLLLTLSLVIPLAGCGNGGGNSDGNNSSHGENTDVERPLLDDEARIVVEYAEAQGNNYVTDKNKIKHYYPDCANYKGDGIYKVGDFVTIEMDLNKSCSIDSWIADGQRESINKDLPYVFRYEVRPDNAKKTVVISPVMVLNDVVNNKENVEVNFEGYTVTEFIDSEPIVIEKIENIIIEGASYKYEKNSEGKEFLVKNGTDKKYEFVEDVISIDTDKGLRIYIVTNRKADGTPLILTPNSTKSTILDSDKMKKFTFVGSDKDPQLTFAEVAGIFGSPISNTSTLADLTKIKSINLNYYKENNQIQYDKVIWKIKYTSKEGKVVQRVIDPANDKNLFPAGSTNYSISANIDRTKGITTEFINNTISNTVYSEAYVSINADKHDCLSATNSIVPVDAQCMYVKNLGNINNKINKPGRKDISDLNSIYYYAMNQDNSLEYNRIEGIETDKDSKEYFSYSKNSDVAYNVDFDKTDIPGYKLRIEELYDALLNKYLNSAYDLDITYRYNEYYKEIAIDTVKINDNTYYFNYVSTPKDEVNYHPGGKNDIISLERSKVRKYDVLFEGVESDTNIKDFAEVFLSNIENVFGIGGVSPSQSEIDLFKNNLKHKIVSIIHEHSYKNISGSHVNFNKLRNCEIEITNDKDQIKVTFVNKQIPITYFTNNNYAYIQNLTDTNKTINFIPYNDSKTGFQTVNKYNLNENLTLLFEYLNMHINDINSNKITKTYFDVFTKDKDTTRFIIKRHYRSEDVDFAFDIKYIYSAKLGHEEEIIGIDTISILNPNQLSSLVAVYKLVDLKESKDLTNAEFNNLNDGTLNLTNTNKFNLTSKDKNKLLKFNMNANTYVLNPDRHSIVTIHPNTHFGKKITELYINYAPDLKFYFTLNGKMYGVYYEKIIIEPDEPSKDSDKVKPLGPKTKGILDDNKDEPPVLTKYCYMLYEINISDEGIPQKVTLDDPGIKLDTEYYATIESNYYNISVIDEPDLGLQEYIYIDNNRINVTNDVEIDLDLVCIKNGDNFINPDVSSILFRINKIISSGIRMDKIAIKKFNQSNLTEVYAFVYKDSSSEIEQILILEPTKNENIYEFNYLGHIYSIEIVFPTVAPIE